MPKISNAIKARYARLDSHVSGKCYYCQVRDASMDDMTPSHKADPGTLGIFEGEWTIARVCSYCWGRINTVNIVNGAARYGGVKGLMTVDQKRLMLSPNTMMLSPVAPGETNLAKMFDGRYLLPSNTMISENNYFFVDGVRFFEEEVVALQAAFALKMLKMEQWIPFHLRAQMNLDNLEVSRMGDYCKVIGIPVPEDDNDDDDQEPTQTYEQWLAQQEAQAGEPDVESDGSS